MTKNETCFVTVAKMTHRTNHFNANQKVFLQAMSGNQAAKVTGKHRGKGRYVSAWIKWNDTEKPCPEWKAIQVDEDFAQRHALATQCK